MEFPWLSPSAIHIISLLFSWLCPPPPRTYHLFFTLLTTILFYSGVCPFLGGVGIFALFNVMRSVESTFFRVRLCSFCSKEFVAVLCWTRVLLVWTHRLFRDFFSRHNLLLGCGQVRCVGLPAVDSGHCARLAVAVVVTPHSHRSGQGRR